jgi:alpha-1,6-mannosyl-glycoprotein beta-1,2-N-acetylglucosaminyltransferase
VHNRIGYLKHLIDSLHKAKDIDKALIIFSHDVYNSSINELVREINFCRVMQIFYPYSIQLYPDTFPGSDPRDCDRDIGRAAALQKGCLNARNNDTYGHYREAKFTQMKHHWWWKLNRIFDELRVTRNLNGMLLLLEEDYYVAPDFLHVYQLMQKITPHKCPQCNLLSLGTYYESLSTHNVLDFFAWQTGKHNMAMAFNKSTWLEVRRCGSHFCNYDEYNYDFSFQNINRRCLKNHFFVALMQGPPRMFHVGECGVHHSKSNCDVEAKISEINDRLDQAWRDNLLYPEKLHVVQRDELFNPSTPLVNNGGWADMRDKCLCNSVINTHGREVDLQKCRAFYEKPIVTRRRRV